MTKRLALSLIALAAAAGLASAPAHAQKTELVALDGAQVDSLQLRYDFNSAWVIDTQNILYRDNSRDYYLVTLKGACEPLGIRGRTFAFHPGSPWKLEASHAYEVRPAAGERCDVGKIAKLDDARANPLRDESLWRAW